MTTTPEAAAPDLPAADAAPCAFGSGLRHGRCCGLDLRTVAPVEADGPFAETLSAITRAWRLQELERVRTLALSVLEEAPGQKDALGALFNVLKGEGAHQAAAQIMHRMATVNANDGMVRLLAVQYFLSVNHLAYAQMHGRMLVRLAPQAARAHLAMGRVFRAINAPVAAEHHVRTGRGFPEVADQPELIREFDLLLAQTLRAQGRLDEARALFATLDDETGPARVELLVALAELDESARNFDAGLALVDSALALAPGDRGALHQRAALLRRMKQTDAALATLDGLATSATAAGEEDGALPAGLARGQILDSLGRYDEAFACFAAAKAQFREQGGRQYQAEPARALVGELTDFFTPGRTALLPRAARRADTPQPIFIVGFPRSGTTLVEQTLDRHPDIAAGDELPIIAALVDRLQMLLGTTLPYPKALSELWLGDRRGLVDTLRDLYLNEAAQIGALDPARPWFTDKMPLNETHLGLIHLLFPESPIVHLVRHPLDVVLSVFSNGLSHGFNCASALETAADHYALIADLIAHYRAVLPLRYHAVRYEDLVADQEREVRALLDFIGVPFDPATLSFHESARYARTASYAQVTEKLYDRSVDRHRHYAAQLAPVVPVLTPAITRLGYALPEAPVASGVAA